jgi:MoaA/NifB/PqqE/SkfB family radical SAM enzyme
MERIIEYGGMKPRISVYCTITEWNTGRLVEFAELFRGMPLKELGFMHTNYTTEATTKLHNNQFGDTYPAAPSSMEQLNFENIDLEELRDEIAKVKKSAYPFHVFFSPELTSKEELINFYFAPENFIGKICNDSFRNVMVKSDGTVIPSHGRCYRVEAGNLYRQTLRDIWNGEPLAAFRRTLMNEGGLLPACSRCCSAF